MKATTLFIFLLILFSQCYKSKKVEEINSENDVIKKKNQEKDSAGEAIFLTDYENLRNYCANKNTYSTFSDTLPQTEPVDKVIINSLKIPNLKFEEEIDGIHNFNFFVLDSKLNGDFFYFTLLSKSKTINISRLYLIVINRETGQIKDWMEVAEKYEYEGSVKNFKAKCLQNKIEIEQHESKQNNAGKLRTFVKTYNLRINEEQKITKNKEISRSYLGKEDAIYLEYDFLFKITIPNMYCVECELSETNPMYRSSSELSGKDTSSFELAEVWGISGSLADNKLILDYNENNIKINSIKMAAASGIFFNQNGSGGVWQQAGSPLSEWVQLSINEKSECILPNTQTILNYSKLTEGQINKAKKKQQENTELNFAIYPAYLIIEIDYNTDGKPNKKYIEFVMGYGD